MHTKHIDVNELDIQLKFCWNFVKDFSSDSMVISWKREASRHLGNNKSAGRHFATLSKNREACRHPGVTWMQHLLCIDSSQRAGCHPRAGAMPNLLPIAPFQEASCRSERECHAKSSLYRSLQQAGCRPLCRYYATSSQYRSVSTSRSQGAPSHSLRGLRLHNYELAF